MPEFFKILNSLGLVVTLLTVNSFKDAEAAVYKFSLNLTEIISPSQRLSCESG